MPHLAVMKVTLRQRHRLDPSASCSPALQQHTEDLSPLGVP
jgi:hypothetical protein